MSLSLLLSQNFLNLYHTLNNRPNLKTFEKEYVSQKEYFLHRTLYYVQRFVSSSEQYDTVEDEENLYQDMIHDIQRECRSSEDLNKN